jgi:outer membrane protein assembly factor BamA
MRFDLADFDGVRGYDGSDLGTKKALLSAELRFPFIDHLQIGFPLPIQFANIRGSAFVDVGAVWDNNDDLQLTETGLLKDMKMGFGFGPRINLGFFILKFDIAWETDLDKVGKPSYYFILSPDF